MYAAITTAIGTSRRREGGALDSVLVRSTGYFVIELKSGIFQPEYAGKLNFNIALVDDGLRREAHNDTVGILICGSLNDHAVRNSLGRAHLARGRCLLHLRYFAGGRPS